MKYIILIGDGMGDLPLPALDGRTPLETAQTPAMDYLSRHGELLLTRTIPDGYPPGSDVANLSLLGYQPQKYYTGRAPLEAASMGVELANDEIACRCNLVTLDRTADGRLSMADYSAGHITTAEARSLIDMINRTIAGTANAERMHFHAGVSYRHLLVYKGELPGLTTVPPHDYSGREVTEYWNRYLNFPDLKILLETVCPRLMEHEVNKIRRQNGRQPANAIWLWGEGKAPVMPTIKEQYGINGALISAVDLLKGIGVYGGLEIINVPGATGYLDTNYAGKAQAALTALQKNDFVFVHVEAPDEAAHQGLIKEKIQAIEDFDQKIVAPIFKGLTESAGQPAFRLVVAMDHFTPISSRTHADLPVPMVLFDSRRTAQGCGLEFTEKNAGEINCLLDNGQIFFKKLLEADREKA